MLRTLGELASHRRYELRTAATPAAAALGDVSPDGREARRSAAADLRQQLTALVAEPRGHLASLAAAPIMSPRLAMGHGQRLLDTLTSSATLSAPTGAPQANTPQPS